MSILDRVRTGVRALSAYHVPSVTAEVKLDANESPYGPSAELSAALAEAVASAPLHRYPDPRAGRLRALIAEDLGQPPGWLVLGNGSDELLSLLCMTFAEPQPRQPRGAVVYPAPSFVVYRTAAVAAGLDVFEAPLGPRFSPDLDALDAVIARHRPGLVFIATPNNPTGTAWPRPLVEALLDRHPETPLVVDEAYVAYGGDRHLDLVARHPNCLVLRTYSKVGLAGLRLGVLVAQPEIVAEVEKVRPPYNLGLLPQLAGELALGRFRAGLAKHVAEVVAEREALAAQLASLGGVEVFPSAANLLLLRVADGPTMWGKLLQQSVLVKNLDRPGPLRHCLRVTIGTPSENKRFLAAFRNALAASGEAR